MTRDPSARPASPLPLSRRVDVERLPQGRGGFTVEASPQECVALAADFGIPAVRDLVGRFEIAGPTSLLRVTGRVEAVVTQTCGVSLEPFESAVREPVEVTFSDAVSPEEEDVLDENGMPDLDRPDALVRGQIDIGALTAEFLALGLDAYPRKPGIAFEEVVAGEDEKPLAGLARLRPRDE